MMVLIQVGLAGETNCSSPMHHGGNIIGQQFDVMDILHNH